ncbi:MAG TPA: radical SAM protein [bacterium]|nr:radical SAM protein [bacterium]
MRRAGVAYLFPAPRRVALSNLAPHYFVNAFRDSHGLDLLFEGEDRSLIDRKRPNEFAVIFVGLSYEPSYLNFARYLHLHGIPILRSDRPDGKFPLIIAGGVAPSLNPQPLLDICDAVLCGEAEPMHGDLTAILNDPAAAREVLPRLYYAAKPGKKPRIAQAAAGSFAVSSHPALTGEGNEFGGRTVLELDRGCVGTCHFCAARHLYGASREADRHRITHAAEEAFKRGKDIALLGTGLESVSYFDDLLDRAIAAGRTVSLSSVRIAGFTPQRASRLAAAGVKTVTLAPESMVVATRKRIGKPLTDDELFAAFETAKAHHFKVKLYLMAGLPDSDSAAEAQAIGAFFAELKDRRLTVPLSLSVTPFCPKPGTPFRGKALMPKKEYERFRDTVQRGAGKLMPQMPVEWFSWRESLLQTAFDRMSAAQGAAFLAVYADGGELRAAEKRSGIRLEDAANETQKKGTAQSK